MKKYLAVLLVLSIYGCQQDNNPLSNGGLKPVVSGMTPASAVRGQKSVNGRITGANFTGVVAVNLGEGLTVVSTESVSATEFKVVFDVAENAVAGPRMISVATA